jgi:membrane fusion protein (multidrug efflux system)
MTERHRQHEGRRMRPGKFLRRLVPALVVLAALVVVVTIYFAVPKRNDDKPVEPPPPTDVKTERVGAEPEVVESFVLVGQVTPDRLVEVSAEVPGRIEQIHATEGQSIEEGKPVVSLNTDLLRAEHDAAKAMAEYDGREHERIADAAKDGVATDKEVDMARAKAAASKAQYDAAKARLARARILAPISGKLDDVVPELGMYVNVGSVVARIVDMDPAKVLVHVPEPDVPYLKLGQTEKIILDEEGKDALTGEITFIGELADPSANATRVEISVPNEPRVLRSGQIVRVSLIRRKFRNAIMIPLEAVIPMEKTRAVYVMDKDGKAERRDDVKLGFIKGDRVLVTEGLKEGDLLIIDGHRALSPGDAVKEAPAEGAGAAGAATALTND